MQKADREQQPHNGCHHVSILDVVNLNAASDAHPERRLMRAVLWTAIEDLTSEAEPSAEAVDYFTSTDRSYLFSFENVCRHLELCPKSIRAVLGVSGELTDTRLAA